jgi:gentisate 1,2-dioxygenase
MSCAVKSEFESRTRFHEPRLFEHVVQEAGRAANGRIVVRGAERLWDMHRQANSKRYLSPFESELQDTATQSWEVQIQVFPERSGRHRHQGGLVIFILEGAGHTVLDGVRHDWEAGDLMLLRMQPGGVEHQHFNHDPRKPAKWVALTFLPFFDYGGSEITQLENSPLYDKWMAKQAERNTEIGITAHRAPKTRSRENSTR